MIKHIYLPDGNVVTELLIDNTCSRFNSFEPKTLQWMLNERSNNNAKFSLEN